MWLSFRAPDAFSGDEDDDGDDDDNETNDATHQATVNTSSDESRWSRVKSRYQRFRSPVQRYWRSQWPARICSMLCCLVFVSFIAIFSSFLYVILKGKTSHHIALAALLTQQAVYVTVHCRVCLMYHLCRYHDIGLCNAAEADINNKDSPMCLLHYKGCIIISRNIVFFQSWN